MSKTKILIDCDPGHDDLVAILYAAKHLDLVGVTTVHGNNTLANTTRNGLIALELGNLQVPLATGCAEPLVQNSIGIGAGHGKSGLDGHDFVDPKINPIDMHAVEFIIELSRKYKEELIIATIGPETNIAMAIKKEPRLKKWIREISIMGGSTTMGNISPVAEFNIAADVEAAAAVFESGIPFRMVGYNITRQTGFNQADIDRLRSSKSALGPPIAGLMQFYLNKQFEMYRLDVAPMHDVCAIIPYVLPNLIEFKHTSIRVETQGIYTRGMTVCDLRHPNGSAELGLRNRTDPNGWVATSANSRALIDAVLDTLINYD